MSPSTGLPGAGNSPALIPVFAEESLGRVAAALQWCRNPRERGLRGDAPLPPELRDALLEAALPGIDRNKLADRASTIRDDDLRPPCTSFTSLLRLSRASLTPTAVCIGFISRSVA